MAIQSVREEQLDRERREQAADTPPLTQAGLRTMMSGAAQGENPLTQARLHEMMNGTPQQAPAASTVTPVRDLGVKSHSAPTPRPDWEVPSPGEPGSAFNPIVRDRPQQARNLPVAAASEMIDASTIPGREVAEDATVPEAVKQGFAQGFTGGLTGGSAVDSASTLGALEQVGEAVEASLSQPTDLAERMDRFPELRGVEVPTGNAARFPELMETAPVPADQELVAAGDYDR